MNNTIIKVAIRILIICLILDLLSCGVGKLSDSSARKDEVQATVQEVKLSEISQSIVGVESILVNRKLNSANFIMKTTQFVGENLQVEEEAELEETEEQDPEERGKIYILAQAMTAEAGGTGDKKEMLLVGAVILNRVESDLSIFYQVQSISEVLAQEGQYPQTWEKIQNGIEPTELALEAAEDLITGKIAVTDLEYNGVQVTPYVLWQTGFIPDWEVEVIFQTKWHYYSEAVAT